MRAQLRRDIEEPRCKKSSTESVAPILTNERKENVDPIIQQSRHDIVDANLLIPTTENALPSRPKDRSDNVLPRKM
jgi:hypothetical protein